MVTTQSSTSGWRKLLNPSEQGIVIAFDKNYANYARVLISQILKFTPAGIEIYAITPNDEEIHEIVKEFSTRARPVIHIPLDFTNYVAILPIISHFTISMYSRLFIPTLLPDRISQSFYIDIDVLIRGNLEELFEKRIEASIGAVAANSEFPHLKTRVAKEDTFYSGMLIINHKRWKEENIFEKCMQIVRNGQESLVYPDNDLLVLVMNRNGNRDWQDIPIEYNYMAYLSKKSDTRILEPLIVHFPGSSKPWNTPFGGRYAREWRASARRTGRIPKLSPGNYIAFSIQTLKNLSYKCVKIIFRLEWKLLTKTGK